MFLYQVSKKIVIYVLPNFVLITILTWMCTAIIALGACVPLNKFIKQYWSKSFFSLVEPFVFNLRKLSLVGRTQQCQLVSCRRDHQGNSSVGYLKR